MIEADIRVTENYNYNVHECLCSLSFGAAFVVALMPRHRVVGTGGLRLIDSIIIMLIARRRACLIKRILIFFPPGAVCQCTHCLGSVPRINVCGATGVTWTTNWISVELESLEGNAQIARKKSLGEQADLREAI